MTQQQTQRPSYHQVILFILVLLHIVSVLASTPPKARKEPSFTVLHGIKLQDDYAWLEQTGARQVKTHLEEEADYYQDQISQENIVDLSNEIHKDILDQYSLHIPSYPFLYHGWRYQSHPSPRSLLQNWYRYKEKSDSSTSKLVLNETKFWQENLSQSPHFKLGLFAVSPDSSLLAFSVDSTGSGKYRLYFKHIESDRVLPITIEDTWPKSFAWASDSRSFFFSSNDALLRLPQALGWGYIENPTSKTHPKLHLSWLQNETDPSLLLEVRPSSNEEYLFLYREGLTQNQVLFIKTLDGVWGNSSPKFTALTELDNTLSYADSYQTEDGEDRFILRTNADGATNFKLVLVSASSLRRIQTLVGPSSSSTIIRFDLVGSSHAICWVDRFESSLQLRVISLRSSISYMIDPPCLSGWCLVSPNAGPRDLLLMSVGENSNFAFSSSSLIESPTHYLLDLESHQYSVFQEQKLPSRSHISDYIIERVYANHQNVSVPITLAYKKSLKTKSSPTILSVHGVHGLEPYAGYRPENLALLDRGVVLALAHVRGGSIMGPEWWREGRAQSKNNAIDDAVYVVKYLTQYHYTSPSRLAIYAHGPGAVVAASLLYLIPSSFSALWLQNPFIEVVNTLSDQNQAYVRYELAEWGNTLEEADFRLQLAYDPYYQLSELARYPAILLEASSSLSSLYSSYQASKLLAKVRSLERGTRSSILDLPSLNDLSPLNELKQQSDHYAFIVNSLLIGKAKGDGWPSWAIFGMIVLVLLIIIVIGLTLRKNHKHFEIVDSRLNEIFRKLQKGKRYSIFEKQQRERGLSKSSVSKSSSLSKDPSPFHRLDESTDYLDDDY